MHLVLPEVVVVAMYQYTHRRVVAFSVFLTRASDRWTIDLQEGIVSAATNLSKLDDEDSMRVCATVFALLSADPLGRNKFVERKSALVSLFDLLRSKDQGTKVICGKVRTFATFKGGALDICSRLLKAWLENQSPTLGFRRRLQARVVYNGVLATGVIAVV